MNVSCACYAVSLSTVLLVATRFTRDSQPARQRHHFTFTFFSCLFLLPVLPPSAAPSVHLHSPDPGRCTAGCAGISASPSSCPVAVQPRQVVARVVRFVGGAAYGSSRVRHLLLFLIHTFIRFFKIRCIFPYFPQTYFVCSYRFYRMHTLSTV